MKFNNSSFQTSNVFGGKEKSFTALNHLQWAADFPFLFSIKQSAIDTVFLEHLSKKGYLSQKKGLPLLLGMKVFEYDDLLLIKKVSSTLLVRADSQRLLSQNISVHSLIDQAQKLGFRVFQDSSISLLPAGLVQDIEFVEYVLSEDNRLSRFPHESISSRTLQAVMSISAIFVLDLIQDFEILSPLIKQFASLCHSRNCVVMVSTRVKASFLWNNISLFLTVLDVSVIFVSSVFDAAQYLPKNSAVLFTASESSALGHHFCYELCRLAPPSLLKVTFQHGHENVGLRHHLSHNTAYPKGIRFASDIIFTWTDKEQLIDAFPSELARCIPVGVTKKTASDALAIRNERYNSCNLNAIYDTVDPKKTISTLLCENLHSVRFNDLKLRDAFLSVIEYLHNAEQVLLKIRSHPGKRLLEQDESFNKFDFLKGELTAEILSKFDLMISPPSTIVLDAVLCGVHTLVWSATRQFGDLRYYDSLHSIDKTNDLFYFLMTSNENRADFAIENLAWAARNTTAFDGTRFVFSQIAELI